jgi:ABC-type glycerol-3-phosphate transport system substrate-binding protein
MRIFTYLVISLLVLGALALLVFGPRTTEPIPPGRIVVEYWEKWAGDEEKKMRSIIDEFNQGEGAQKNIYVRYLSMSNVYQKTLVATGGGAPPDIAGMFDWNLVQYASLGAIQPLDELAKSHGIDENTYKPVYWRSMNYDGHLWALISTPASIGLLYNKKIFQEEAATLRAHGLDPDRPPQTIDELDKYAAALDKQDATGRIARAGTIPVEPGWYLDYLPIWFDGNIWDEKNHKFTLTDPKTVKAFEWIKSYSRKLGSRAVKEFYTTLGGGTGNFDSPQNPFMHGDVVMEMNGPWMANYIYNNNPQLSKPRLTMSHADEMKLTMEERRKLYDWAVAPWPSDDPNKKDVAYCTSDVMMIPVGAKHPKEAFEFMAYLTRQDVMEKICKLHCKNSPLAKVSDDFKHDHDNPYVDVFERLASSPNAQFAPRIPIFQEVHDALEVVIQNLALTDAETLPTLQAAQIRLQAMYDEFIEKQNARHPAGPAASK